MPISENDPNFKIKS